MRHKVFIALIVGASVSLAAGVAMAKDHRAQGAAFETLDADGDGRITRAEAEAMAAGRMAAADTDGDGALSLAEIEAHGAARAKERAARMMERLDADKDGRLTAEEMRAGKRAGRMFDRADADGDGVITKAEFDEAREKMRRRHGRDAG